MSAERSLALLWVLPLLATAAQAAPSALGMRFTDVTRQAQITFRHVNGATPQRHFIETMGPGCAFVDYDRDGRLDIYLVNGHELGPGSSPAPGNVLYRNDGDGTFSDVTAAAGVGDRGYGVGVAAADYDNDGDTDLYVTNFGPNVLYRNNGDGTFSDVTAMAGVGDPHWGVGCAFVDYDGDGFADLYVANYVDFRLDSGQQAVVPYLPMSTGTRGLKGVTAYPHPDNYDGVSDVLYRNQGDGTFLDVTRRAGVFNPTGKGMGMACSDVDNDGDQDIYVANDATPNFLYRNNGDGTFTEVGLISGVAYNADGRAESSMGVDFGDYDRDGHIDLVVPNFQTEACALYRNAGNGTFTEESATTGIGPPTRPMVGWGVGFLDGDNDGYLDLFIANGHVLDNVELFDSSTTYGQRNQLFRNRGPGADGRCTFAPVDPGTGTGLAVAKPSRGASFGDYDDDGDVDILVANCNDTPTLLRNDTAPRGNWLRIELEGSASNRSAIGARVTAYTRGLPQVREVRAGSSLYSQSDLRVHFGLGTDRSVSRLTVRWPSGRVQTLTDLVANRTVRVREGGGEF